MKIKKKKIHSYRPSENALQDHSVSSPSCGRHCPLQPSSGRRGPAGSPASPGSGSNRPAAQSASGPTFFDGTSATCRVQTRRRQRADPSIEPNRRNAKESGTDGRAGGGGQQLTDLKTTTSPREKSWPARQRRSSSPTSPWAWIVGRLSHIKSYKILNINKKIIDYKICL